MKLEYLVLLRVSGFNVNSLDVECFVSSYLFFSEGSFMRTVVAAVRISANGAAAGPAGGMLTT